MGPTLLCPTSMKLLLQINLLPAQEADLKRYNGSVWLLLVFLCNISGQKEETYGKKACTHRHA